MEHGLELYIYIYNYCSPGNVGHRSLQHYPGSWKYWKSRFLIQLHPGSIGKRIFFDFPRLGNVGSSDFSTFLFFPPKKKTRAEISRRMHRSRPRDLSYETDSGPKAKIVPGPNFQVTAATTAAVATATPQQLSRLARTLNPHAQGPNTPFGVSPSLRRFLDL